eukprot:TRINITY_DN3909_c0_g1_i3.p1 TRINITY_DN3909_c0_g1~~TRINITY_DN3909_c0_g1_i3.p1  ORF type:complete len:599 (+),score=98.20 TRINITY_DN3909_c0_g1_i3:50-1846(+)
MIRVPPRSSVLSRSTSDTSSHHSYTILVLGGYGNFGKLLCDRLKKTTSPKSSEDDPVRVLVGGRNLTSAKEFARSLNDGVSCLQFEPFCIDLDAPNLSLRLKEAKADLVVHTCGPYLKTEGSTEYIVANACIEAGSNYIDLADARDFVTDFSAKLDKAAKERGVTLIAGASTVPGLTSAVVDHMKGNFSSLEGVEMCINAGFRTKSRGLGTVKSVLLYCGKPFSIWNRGQQEVVTGWTSPRLYRVSGLVNRRVGSYCNIPDVALFPKYYPSLNKVIFRAGVEIKTIQAAFAAMAYLAKLNLVKDWSRYAAPLKKFSDTFEPVLGTDEGGMNVTLSGLGKDGQPLNMTWDIFAGKGHGPFIPSTPSVILMQKMMRGDKFGAGAFPCVSMFTLKEFMTSVQDLDVLTYSFDDDRSTIFERALTEDSLSVFPKNCLRFHTEGGEVAGTLQVRRGTTILSRLIAWLGNLPEANPAAPVTVVNSRNVWSRAFGSKAFASQWRFNPQHGLVEESFLGGLVRFGFQLKPIWETSQRDPSQRHLKGFSHITKRNWVLGVPLPSFLMVKADGETRFKNEDNGWDVTVKVEHPLAGLVCSYEGSVFFK